MSTICRRSVAILQVRWSSGNSFLERQPWTHAPKGVENAAGHEHTDVSPQVVPGFSLFGAWSRTAGVRPCAFGRAAAERGAADGRSRRSDFFEGHRADLSEEVSGVPPAGLEDRKSVV